MSEQQLAFAKVRAVEHDRYVVVAGTTGISAVIAPDGGELDRTDFFEPAYLDMQVRLKTTADAGNPLGADPAVGPGRGGWSGHSGRNTAQWVVPASGAWRSGPPDGESDDTGQAPRMKRRRLDQSTQG